MTDGKEVQAQGSGADGEGWNTGSGAVTPMSFKLQYILPNQIELLPYAPQLHSS